MSSALEESLTNSIKRAKEKIYSQNHSLLSQHHYPHQFSSDADLSKNTLFADSRTRTHSHHIEKPSAHSKPQQNALAAAMKNLQERIVTLEREKNDLTSRPQPSSSSERQRHLDQELSRVGKQLQQTREERNQKQVELRSLTKQNLNLNRKNTELSDKNIQLQDQLERLQRKVTSLERMEHISRRENQQTGGTRDGQVSHMLLAKDKKIAQLQQKINQSMQRNELSHQTIERVMKELEETKGELKKQKKTNLKWLNMFQEQLPSPNENNSLISNHPEKERTPTQHHRKPREPSSQLQKNNRELSQMVQKQKIKICNLNRQLYPIQLSRKQSREKYQKLKVIVGELVDSVHRIAPNNCNLRFLLNKIDKIEHCHLQSLRSLSGHSRRRPFRQSTPNSHKKSLKMSDLDSNSKRSGQRSATKSNRKIKISQPLSHSEKKSRIVSQQQVEIQSLERQIKTLNKEYRNQIAKHGQEGGQVDGQAEAILAKKEQLEQLKRRFRGSHRKSREHILSQK